jgi:hypothetical protein
MVFPGMVAKVVTGHIILVAAWDALFQFFKPVNNNVELC